MGISIVGFGLFGCWRGNCGVVLVEKVEGGKRFLK